MLLCVLAVCGEGWGALAGEGGGWGGWVDVGSVVNGGWEGVLDGGFGILWSCQIDIPGTVRLPRNLINGLRSA